MGREAANISQGFWLAKQLKSCNKTQIQLNFKPAAEAFPLLLDYMYGLDGGEPALTIENAAPVYHLADYFEVESLHPKIWRFWEQNMGVDDLTTCLRQAATYHIETLEAIVVFICSETISDIAVDSSLLEETDSKFWVDVQEEQKNSPEGMHPWVFTLIAEFCSKRKDDMDANAFKVLTGPFPRYLPISFDDAVKFLQVEKGLLPASEGLTQLQLKKWLKFLCRIGSTGNSLP